jgi:pimeloyl-ACP methyl ester carboxylesterase
MVAYDVSGNGPPVALVSGLAQVGRRWRRVVERMAPDYTVVTIDNRETGRAGAFPDGFTLADMGADVLAVMTELDHERFFLGGISMGGMIAQEVIRQAPERVRSAVLLATAGGQTGYVPPPDMTILMNPDPVAMWAALTGPAFRDAHPEVVAEEAALSVEAATPLDGVMRQVQAIAAWDPLDAIADTDVPIVVAHGDADPLVPYENGVNLAKKLGVELVTYEGSGHVLESERVDDVVALMRRVFT